MITLNLTCGCFFLIKEVPIGHEWVHEVEGYSNCKEHEGKLKVRSINETQ